MEIDFKVEVDHHWVYERPYKVTLTRGAKGDYRWEIEVRDADIADACDNVTAVDDRLSKVYGILEPIGEEG